MLEFNKKYLQKHYLISFSRDISADGMFIHTESPPEVGQKVDLHFSIDGVEKLKIPARVVWVNKSENPKDAGVGVKFIRPKAALKESIMKAVNKVAILEKPGSKKKN